MIQYVTENELTWLSLFNLFCRQRKGREQLYEYLDHHLIHSNRRRDLGIDIESLQKVFDRLKQINQCIVAVNDALDPLIGLLVTKMRD